MQDITSKRETMKMLKESYITLSEQAQIVLSNMQSMQNEALDTVNVTGETIKVLKAKENALEAEEAEMLNVILRRTNDLAASFLEIYAYKQCIRLEVSSDIL